MTSFKKAGNIILLNRYVLLHKIGNGSFGEVFEAKDRLNNRRVAVKFENQRNKRGISQLHYEYRVYKLLRKKQGIPKVHYFGRIGDYNVLIMQLLGHDLQKTFDQHNRFLSIQQVFSIGIKAIDLLHAIHAVGLIHRDIKPQNFCLQFEDKKKPKLYLIDFGLSKRFMDPATNAHITYREGKSLTGTPRYASVNTLMGIEQSRRDDLESLGYMLVFFLKKRLPWQGIRAKKKRDKHQKILAEKINTSLAKLCHGLPLELKTYLEYCKRLGFDDTPDYAYLKELFMQVLK